MVTRRQFLYLFGGSAATTILSGCSPASSNATPTIPLTATWSHSNLPSATAVFTPIAPNGSQSMKGMLMQAGKTPCY